MSALANAVCIARQEGQGAAWNGMVIQQFGLEAASFSLPPIFAITQNALAVPICGTCASGVTCGMTCNYTRRIEENAGNERLDS